MMHALRTTGVGFALLCACGGESVSIGSNPAAIGSSSGAGRPSGGTGGMISGGGALARGGSTSPATGGVTAQAGAASGGTLNTPIAGSGGGGASAGNGGVPVARVSGCARQLASGDSHLCVLFEDGKVACAGENASGELGVGVVSDTIDLTNYVFGLEGASMLAAGGHHTCAVAADGVYCWGDNAGSELGQPSSEVILSSLPTLALPAGSLGFGVVQLALGTRQSCVLDQLTHGTCWGIESAGKVELTQPTQLGQIGLASRQILQMGSGYTRLLEGERLYEVDWGSDALAIVPGASTGVVENAFGRNHDCLLKRSGMVFCKGEDYPTFYSAVVDFGTDVVEVKAGAGFTCARTRQGQVLCRGRNDVGQLGNGAPSPSTRARTNAAPVPGIDQAVELSLGARHACARLRDASVWCWGTLPGAPQRNLPERITGPEGAQMCAEAASVPRPWGEAPPARPVDELNDAALAWGQNQCRCAFPESGNADDLASCVRHETVLLNGCLQALALNESEYATCRTPLFWDAATCALNCLETGASPNTCLAPPAECGVASGALDFCLRHYLACDSMDLDTVPSSQTCDGIPDCPNAFDEANCKPNAIAFTCADGSKIPLELVHDGASHCPDGSDDWRY